MLKLLDTCENVITDSGGLQREAYILKKKSLLVLDYTPWEELVKSKCAITSSLETNDILKKYKKLSSLKPNFKGKLYGSGNGAKKITSEIVKFMKDSNL
jgi:UDP-GlcNAc3NAcA epimerase